MKITRKPTDDFKPFEITITVENKNDRNFLKAIFGYCSLNEIWEKSKQSFNKEKLSYDLYDLYNAVNNDSYL